MSQLSNKKESLDDFLEGFSGWNDAYFNQRIIARLSQNHDNAKQSQPVQKAFINFI
jgi:hypothetical protein